MTTKNLRAGEGSTEPTDSPTAPTAGDGRSAATPGPWRTSYSGASGHCIFGLAPNGSHPQIGVMFTQQDFVSTQEAKANARLAAAAPELLKCLRRMCGLYGAHSKRLAPLLAMDDDGVVWTFERATELAHEAIWKAEGR